MSVAEKYKFFYVTPGGHYWAIYSTGRKRRISSNVFNNLCNSIPIISYERSRNIKRKHCSIAALIIKPTASLVKYNATFFRHKAFAELLNFLNIGLNPDHRYVKTPILLFECLRYIQNFSRDFFSTNDCLNLDIYQKCLLYVCNISYKFKIKQNIQNILKKPRYIWGSDMYNLQLKYSIQTSYNKHQENALKTRETFIQYTNLSTRTKFKLRKFYFTPEYKNKIRDYTEIQTKPLISKLSFEKTLDYYELRSRLERNNLQFYQLLETFDPPYFFKITKPYSIHVKYIEIFSGRLFPRCPVTGKPDHSECFIHEVCNAIKGIENNCPSYAQEWFHIKECLERFYSLKVEVWHWAYFRLISNFDTSLKTQIQWRDRELKTKYHTSVDYLCWDIDLNNWKIYYKT